MKIIAVLALLASATAQPSHAPSAPAEPSGPSVREQFESYRVAQRRSCKAASTCEEAVRMWCDGYAGADRDKDGIPCESVCRSKAQVDEIKAAIGC
ncbi:excalibur calcium-binding domain-containing protein [Antarcticirhabdus aurantiaca]|uniref:Excalibur calcium-binding domain-containing protein n=1 Tax=Antarcticirhabdus aurantiaca TaxID=2606717 RepID=A0ACD4NWE8_9HYPH|nr:excalibur calcium-binding domain-containing protein [Antarcticirhabdus aurantiaca]WAJ31187.1 excalibur calcium-binding domain-containing protein [Jeongeuplla avenae]